VLCVSGLPVPHDLTAGMTSGSGVVYGKAPGLGLGWTRVATAVAGAMPTADIDRIWLFAPVRREDHEWGTAVVERRGGGDRVRLYTASYTLVIRGRERGQGRVAVLEVGEGPASVVNDVVRGVQERAGEAEPPVEIATSLWFGEEHEQSPAQG
jgi:hypothetical protein